MRNDGDRQRRSQSQDFNTLIYVTIRQKYGIPKVHRLCAFVALVTWKTAIYIHVHTSCPHYPHLTTLFVSLLTH